jgi:hypothetical protein
MVCQMLTELTIIAAGKRVSDDRGDLQRSQEMGISFEGQVEVSKVHQRSRRCSRDEGRNKKTFKTVREVC